MPRFACNDIVLVTSPGSARLGQRAWVVDIIEEKSRQGRHFLRFAPGIVYTVEFEDGSSADVHENDLVISA